jgi:DNA mismatch repair protein MutL
VNLLALQQQALQEQLVQLSLPLASRPLLVPIRYSLPAKSRVTEWTNYLGQLGIQLELAGESELLIRTIPLSIPYLDLRLFLDAVAVLETLSVAGLLELISQSQTFDPRLLSHEEKMELNQLLIKSQGQENKKPGLYKALTVEDCRNLLHV